MSAFGTSVCIFDLIFIREDGPAGTLTVGPRITTLTRLAVFAPFFGALHLTVDRAVLSAAKTSIYGRLEMGSVVLIKSPTLRRHLQSRLVYFMVAPSATLRAPR